MEQSDGFALYCFMGLVPRFTWAVVCTITYISSGLVQKYWMAILFSFLELEEL